MNVEVCTVWAPRPESAQWRDDYLEMIDYQKKTVRFYGHKHTVVTDDFSLGWRYDVLPVTLPEEVMPAMIAGVIHRLSYPVDSHLVFVDADVLVAKKLGRVFDGSFDLGLTFRLNNEIAPINNGVMYVDFDGVAKAREFYQRALSICGNHWGADQESISAVAMPVPSEPCIQERENGLRIHFMDMKKYAAVPKQQGMKHHHAYCVHFKGITKNWLKQYSDNFIIRV